MLAIGAKAPEIDAVATDGQRFVLSEQDGLCTVIYFFPKAFTPGCTAETKLFSKNYNEIVLAGATLVGISTDDHSTQCEFARSLDAPFPMIADKDKGIARAYDVLWPLIGVTKRVTYVVNEERVVEAVFRHEIAVSSHRDDVLRFVDEKLRKKRGER